MNEVSISSARASVMVYDDSNKKWVPSGSSSGLSKVQLYHHQVNNTFRVVGRKLQDHEIVINCAILKGLKYNQATVTFHQWRDNKQVYGLNFSSKDDADAFARAMLQALDVLSNGSNISRSLGPTVAPAAQPVYQQQQQVNAAQFDEDMGYSQGQTAMGISRVSLSLGLIAGGSPGPLVAPSTLTSTTTPNHPSPISSGTTTVIQVGGASCPRGSPAENPMRTMTREDVAIIQERRMSQQNQVINSPSAVSPSCPPPSQQQSGHHRTSSAPPAPQPPVMPVMMNSGPSQIPVSGPPVPPPQPPSAIVAPPAPPCPPCPPASMNFIAPVPPPMTNQYAPSQPPIQSQSQSIYGTNQGNQYGVVQSNQYSGGSQSSQHGGSQNNLYGVTGQNNHYGISQCNQNSQYASSQGSQYGGSQGSQYGSSNSINQYGSSQNQYGVSAQNLSQYAASNVQNPSQYTGSNGQNQVQYAVNSAVNQYVSVQSNNSSSPYGTPSNSVNQFSGHAVNANTYAPVGSSGPPPPPMGPSGGPPGGPAAPPPPPPPPAPNANTAAESSPDINSLAAALQAARLKKKQQSQPVENSGSSTSSSGSATGGGGGNYGTLGRGGGGGIASMMDEMAKTLARRRAAVEKKQPEQPPEPENSPDKKTWDKNNSSNNKFLNGAESPKSARKRFGSASEDTLLKVNGVNDGAPLTAQEIEAFKAEFIKDIRKEFQKMKQEIIDALRTELSRR